MRTVQKYGAGSIVTRHWGLTAQSADKRRFSKGDPYGRTGRAQVLHIQLDYVDGTKGEMNLVSPHIAWGSDIESQYAVVRQYINAEYVKLGIVRYHAHCATITQQGAIRIAWSWFAYDLLTQQEIRP